MVLLRVRLRFDSTPLDYSRLCWFAFDPDRYSLVGDLAYDVARHFGLDTRAGVQVKTLLVETHPSSLVHPSPLQLFMDGFLIPTNESVAIIRDNDTLE